MSLFGALRLGSNALQANQIAMQVVGQNIANSNTPGYIREETVLMPAPAVRMGNLVLGLGVRVDAVIQKIDRFLEERLRGAVSEQVSAETQESAYSQLEQLIGEFSDTDISTAMTRFFNSISEVLNQPENVSARNLAVLNARTLTQRINALAQGVNQLRSDLNQRVWGIADEINRLSGEIRDLNVQIVEIEASSVSNSEAVGLRDQRQVALEKLAQLLDIKVREQDAGGVTVYAGGDFLVSEGIQHRVEVVVSGDRGLAAASLRFVDSNAAVAPSGGELHGLTVARDHILGGFLDRLDDFAATLAFEFNKVFSSGQGLHGYTAATSEAFGLSATKPLDQAGLLFPPVNGSFQLLLYDTKSKTTRTFDIPVHLLGDHTDTTLEDLVQALNSTGAISAQITAEGRLSLASPSDTEQFAFANDTSGVLAALGINTLFTGSTALHLGIHPAIASDPAKFAASRGGIGVDTRNAVMLAQFADRPIASHNGESITIVYDRLVAETAQGSTVTHAAADSARAFEQTLRGQKLAISGVNVDEEAITMLAIQKAFQATARYIGVVNQLLDALLSI